MILVRRNPFEPMMTMCDAMHRQFHETAGQVRGDGATGTTGIGSVANFDFRGKIRKSALVNSMTYRCQNSRKSNFATEPEILHDGLPMTGIP
jgi:hypothetical protein